MYFRGRFMHFVSYGLTGRNLSWCKSSKSSTLNRRSRGEADFSRQLALGWQQMKHLAIYYSVRVAFLATTLIYSPLPAAELTRGPYLQVSTSESVIIRWRTDLPTESVVWYGLETNNLPFSVSNLSPTNEHIVSLSALAPGTRHYYSIGSTSQTLAAGDSCTFVTAPNPGHPGPTRIWALGDFGGLSMGFDEGNTNFTYGELAVRDAYVQYSGARQADVWLPLGDNAYWSGTDQEYQTNFFYVFNSILRQVPVFPAIGNHDTYAVPPGQRIPLLDIFSSPTNGEAGGVASGRAEYYSFDRANIHFICLDSMTQNRATNGAMANWLRSDLAANTNPWVIAYFHHSPYSKGSHSSDAPTEIEMNEMRQNIVPILEAGGVDLVLSGHTHVYERSYLLRGHYGYSTNLSPEMILDPGSGRENETGAYFKPTSGPLANRGTVYVVVGTGCCLEGQMGHHPAMFTDKVQLGSLILDIYSNRLDGIFLRETGAIDDNFTIIKDSPQSITWSGLTDKTTWDLGINNWSNVVEQLDGESFNLGDQVRFDDSTTNRAVTLSGVLTPSSVIVETSNSFRFTGSGSLTGPTSLTKRGIGTLHLGTANDYSGQTTVNGGTLSLSGGNAIGDSSAVVMANIAKTALIITNGETIGSLARGGTTGGNVLLVGGTLTTGGNDNSTVFAANISGMGSLSKRGNGTMTLTGFTVLLGSLWVNSGALVVDASGSITTFDYQSIGVDAGDSGQLILKGSSTYAVANDFNIGELGDAIGILDVSNNASLTVTRLFVGAANGPGSTASGTVNQFGGTVSATSTSPDDFIIGGRDPNSTNGNGIYNLNGGALIANGTVSVGGWGRGAVNQSGGVFTAASPDGGIVLQQNSGPGGFYNLNGGVLRTFGITTGITSSDPSFNSVFYFNGGTLQPTANNTAFMQALSRATVRDGGAVIDTAGFDITINQPLLQPDAGGDAGTGGLTKNGAGTLTLSGENTYRGGTILNGGVLCISADNNLGFSTGSLSISNGTTLRSTANLILSPFRLVLLGPPGGVVQSDGSQASAIIDVAAGTTADVRSRILGTNDNGTARLIKTGDGLLILNNSNFNNSFNGGLYLHGGLTKTGPGPQFGDSILTQDNGAGLISNLEGVFNAPSFIGSGNAVHESGLGYTVHRNGPVRNVDELAHSGGLTFQGDETAGDPALNAGKVGLGGTNTFGGVGQAVVVNTNFTLAISQDANLGSPANLLILNSGILQVEHGASSDGTNASVAVAANVTTTRHIELTGKAIINVMNQSDPKNAQVAAINNGAIGETTINAPGSVTGSGSLTKGGPGRLTLAGDIGYTGDTTVIGGTLALTQPTLHSNATVTVAAGAILRLDFLTTNQIAGLVLNGVSRPPGTYNSANSSPYLAGVGNLVVPLPGPVVLTNNVNGNLLSLSWPAGQNWILQMQRNSLAEGLSTNWADVPGTVSISSTNLSIDANQPTTFYRLRR